METNNNQIYCDILYKYKTFIFFNDFKTFKFNIKTQRQYIFFEMLQKKIIIFWSEKFVKEIKNTIIFKIKLKQTSSY